MIAAAFDCAHRLFGLSFAERKDIPVWHPDVRVWDVKNSKGEHRRCSTATTSRAPPSAPARG
jgi:peptidyl-dipeptidase Dcp